MNIYDAIIKAVNENDCSNFDFDRIFVNDTDYVVPTIFYDTNKIRRSVIVTFSDHYFFTTDHTKSDLSFGYYFARINFTGKIEFYDASDPNNPIFINEPKYPKYWAENKIDEVTNFLLDKFKRKFISENN